MKSNTRFVLILGAAIWAALVFCGFAASHAVSRGPIARALIEQKSPLLDFLSPFLTAWPTIAAGLMAVIAVAILLDNGIPKALLLTGFLSFVCVFSANAVSEGVMIHEQRNFPFANRLTEMMARRGRHRYYGNIAQGLGLVLIVTGTLMNSSKGSQNASPLASSETT